MSQQKKRQGTHTRIRMPRHDDSGRGGGGLRGVCASLLGGALCTVIITIMIAIASVIPITMIVFGSIYLNDCPAQRFIPIYLIVMGVVGLVKIISSLIQRLMNDKDDEDNFRTNPFDSILGCFLLAWFIAGNVWIYGLHFQRGVTWQDSDPDPTVDPLLVPTEAPLNYCHPTLFWFSFWVTTSGYILMIVGLCGGCCFALVSALILHRER